MNNNFLIISGLVLATFASLYVVTGSDVPNPVSYQVDETINSSHSQIPADSSENVDIKYSQTTSPVAKSTPPALAASNPDKPKIRKLPVEVAAITKDRSRTYEITLIDPLKTTEGLSTDTRVLQGDIGNKPFFLPVPKNLIDSGRTDLKLQVRDLTSNQTFSIPAPFVNDMRDPTEHQSISINPSNPQNYTQTSTTQVAPLRPGQ